MEQARYWMWAKRKHNSLMSASHHVQVPSQDDSSWEEQAFAEDAAGPLGGHPLYHLPPSRSILTANRYYNKSVARNTEGAKKISRIVESGSCRANKGDYVTTDLSRGLKYLATPSSIEELDLELRLGDRPKVIKVDK
ncbi:hypothetical protein M0R45_029154 [Rubus argutus]|uniref:Uncharacterized protein n=1 Tax=Rubus argutus TaxID=59490 RepID=A0AAW1W7N2_RUBAR